MPDKRFCYFIPVDAEQAPGGFIPSAVHEGESGHAPMKGKPDQAPWVWGPSREEAEATARHMNERMDLTNEDVDLIIASSMGAGKVEQAYASITHDEFMTALHQVLADRSANDLLGIEGVYEILSEHFNNEVVEQALENRERRDE